MPCKDSSRRKISVIFINSVEIYNTTFFIITVPNVASFIYRLDSVRAAALSAATPSVNTSMLRQQHQQQQAVREKVAQVH